MVYMAATPATPVTPTPMEIIPTPAPASKPISFWAHLGAICVTVLGLASAVASVLQLVPLPPHVGLIIAGVGTVTTQILHLCGVTPPTPKQAADEVGIKL